MTTVHVSQTVGDEEVELAVTLDGDGGIAEVQRVQTDSYSQRLWYERLPPEIARQLDWSELAEEARAALRRYVRGWP